VAEAFLAAQAKLGELLAGDPLIMVCFLVRHQGAWSGELRSRMDELFVLN